MPVLMAVADAAVDSHQFSHCLNLMRISYDDFYDLVFSVFDLTQYFSKFFVQEVFLQNYSLLTFFYTQQAYSFFLFCPCIFSKIFLFFKIKTSSSFISNVSTRKLCLSFKKLNLTRFRFLMRNAGREIYSLQLKQIITSSNVAIVLFDLCQKASSLSNGGKTKLFLIFFLFNLQFFVGFLQNFPLNVFNFGSQDLHSSQNLQLLISFSCDCLSILCRKWNK